MCTGVCECVRACTGVGVRLKYPLNKPNMGGEMAGKAPKQTPAQPRPGAGEPRPEPQAFSETPGAGAQGRKLVEVQRLSELKPGTYWYRRLDTPRGWIVTVSAFENNTKIRISAVTSRGLVQILNLNYDRLSDLLDILKKIDERLPQQLKQKKATDQGGEW